ncbi:MAG: hypothetical protein ACOCWM_04000 [Cyclobacteriaceae bacterium]
MNTYKIFVILIMLTTISSCNFPTHEGISIQNHSSDTLVLKVFNEDHDDASFFLWQYHKEIEDFVIDSVTVSQTGHSINQTARKYFFHNYNTKKIEKALTDGSTDSSSYYRRNLKLLFHRKAVVPLYTLRRIDDSQPVTDSILESRCYPPTPTELLVINRYFHEQDSFIIFSLPFNFKKLQNVELMIPPHKELIFLCGGGHESAKWFFWIHDWKIL